MLDHKIHRIDITGDHITLVYSLYTSEETTRDEYNPDTDSFEPVTRQRLQEKVSDDTIVFTRADAYNIALQMGATDVAEEIKSTTMEQIGKTYNDLLDAYLKSQYAS